MYGVASAQFSVYREIFKVSNLENLTTRIFFSIIFIIAIIRAIKKVAHASISKSMGCRLPNTNN